MAREGLGIWLFGDKATYDPHRFTLTESTVLPGGAIFLTYSR